VAWLNYLSQAVEPDLAARVAPITQPVVAAVVEADLECLLLIFQLMSYRTQT
jgi:hypothetical protein